VIEKFGEYSSYAQITGLKDKTVQNKINTEIKSSVDSFLGMHTKYKDLFISAYVSANFSDVISIHLSAIYSNPNGR